MNIQNQSLLLLKVNKLRVEFAKNEKADMTRTMVLLEELRSISDDPDTNDIPLEAFQIMGADLRRAAFDTFLGLMASHTGEIFKEVNPHTS